MAQLSNQEVKELVGNALLEKVKNVDSFSDAAIIFKMVDDINSVIDEHLPVSGKGSGRGRKKKGE